jgi:hypothetical protein
MQPSLVAGNDRSGRAARSAATAIGRKRRGRAVSGLRPGAATHAHAAQEAIPRTLKIFGTVVAPTTLLTALLFYFGRLHITGMFRYLGVNFTVLDLSFQDYLVRSADGLFVPLAIASALALSILWLRILAVRIVPDPTRRKLGIWLRPLGAAIGLAMVFYAGAALSAVFPAGGTPEIPGLCLAGGVVMGAICNQPSRRSGSTSAVVAEWSAVFVIVSVGLFWAIGEYAIGVGSARGQQLGELAGQPDVILRSDHDLGIIGPGLRATTCGNSASPSGYRYDGLRLVIQSSGQYLFLPEGWTPATGGAIVVPRTDEIHLEFVGAAARIPSTC